MLKVKAVSFGDLAVDCLLNPGNLVHQLVAKLVEHVKCKPVLGVDHPDEEIAIFLYFIKWDVKDLRVRERVIGDSHSSGWVCA